MAAGESFAHALKGVDDTDITQAYLGYFYWAAPLLVVIVGVAAALVRVSLRRETALARAAAVAGAAVLAAMVPQHRDNKDDPPAKYCGNPQIPHAVKQLAASAGGRPIVLNILNRDWIDTVGLIAYADPIGVRSCVVGVQWTILFRAQSICTPGDTRSGVTYWLGSPHRHLRPGWTLAATLPTAWISRRTAQPPHARRPQRPAGYDSVAPLGSVTPLGSGSLSAAGSPSAGSPSSARSGGFLRRWENTNQVSPTMVMTSAMKKFSRSPRKCAEESILIVSSKIR